MTTKERIESTQDAIAGAKINQLALKLGLKNLKQTINNQLNIKDEFWGIMEDNLSYLDQELNTIELHTSILLKSN